MADERPPLPPDEAFTANPRPIPQEIALEASPAPVQRKSVAKPANAPGMDNSGVRELFETIVFVVVLVLLLKTFAAEAFVIPTGSMATTLLGYHRDVVCAKCGYPFKANASSEADPQEAEPQLVIGAWCPNCRFYNALRPDMQGGDR